MIFNFIEVRYDFCLLLKLRTLCFRATCKCKYYTTLHVVKILNNRNKARYSLVLVFMSRALFLLFNIFIIKCKTKKKLEAWSWIDKLSLYLKIIQLKYIVWDLIKRHYISIWIYFFVLLNGMNLRNIYNSVIETKSNKKLFPKNWTFGIDFQNKNFQFKQWLPIIIL